MPVPNPTTLELAQAGALIVGVERREAALWSERESRLELARPAWATSVVFLVFSVLVLFVVPADQRWTAASGAVAIIIAAIALMATMHHEPPLDLTAGYRPEELAQLVGYVEVTDVPGVMRRTGLGDQAVAAYLAWREPAPASDPSSERRPLEAS